MAVDEGRLEAVFRAARQIGDADARAALLDRECGGDAELRQRVESLLRIATPGGERDRTVARPRPEARPGIPERLRHYSLLELLGQGGFGKVFKAFDEGLHRVVAIKMMTEEAAATHMARERFLREARAVAALRHENIVQVHVVEEEPVPFLVMEYVAGETLQQRIDRGPIELPELLRLGRQIALGLAAAHERGLIHRDIKPANVLLEHDREPRARLTDFGLARAVDDVRLTQSGMIVGSPLYMAPEQALGEDVDHRADLFSLGSVLYEMASGQAAFDAETSLGVLRKVAEENPRALRELNPHLPRPLCDLIAKLHAKSPADRPSSARAVAEMLEQWQTEVTSGVTPRGTTERIVAKAPPPAARRIGLLWPAVVVGLLLLAGGIAATILLTRSGLGRVVVQADDGLPAGWQDGAVEFYDAADRLQYSLALKEREKPIRAGEYRVRLSGKGLRVKFSDGEGRDLPAERLAVPSGGRVVVHVLRPESPGNTVPLATLLTSPEYEWSPPENLGPAINGPGRDLAATLTDDERTLVYFHDGKLCICRRASRDEPFTTVEPLAASINESVGEVSSISGDGLLLMFSKRTGPIAESICMSQRTALGQPFGEPERLPAPVNSRGWERVPFLSADGLMLMVTSSGRPTGGLGGGDIVRFTRQDRNAPFGAESVLPAPVNTPRFDIVDWLSADQSVLVRSTDNKAWLLVRPAPGAPFGPQRSLGPPFDTSPCGRPWLSPDGQRMYFHSREIAGGQGELDLWMTRRVRKPGAR